MALTRRLTLLKPTADGGGFFGGVGPTAPTTKCAGVHGNTCTGVVGSAVACLRVGASDASGVRRDGARPSNRHTRARMCGGARLRDIKRLCASSVVSTNCSNCSWCTNGAIWVSARVRQVPIEGGRGDSSGMRATSSRRTLFSELEQSSAKIDLHCKASCT